MPTDAPRAQAARREGARRPALTLVLPLPTRLLSPNGRGHWTAIREAKEAARWRAKLAARTVLMFLEQSTPYFPAGVRVRVTATAWPRQRNHEPDDDNLKASCKAYWDGFTDAGVWEDDKQAVWGDVTWQEPGERRGHIVFTLAAEEA